MKRKNGGRSRFLGKLQGLWVVFFLMLSACAHHSESLAPMPSVIQSHPPMAVVWQDHRLKGYEHPWLSHMSDCDGTVIYTADEQGRLLAQTLEGGKLLWELKTHLPITVGPVVVGDLLLLGTHGGQLLALDKHQGQIQWSTTLSSEVLARPVADAQFIYVHTQDGQVAALERETGEKRWGAMLSQSALILRGGSTPAVEGGLLYVGTSDGKIVALEAQTGMFQWERVVAVPKGRSEVERMVDVVADVWADPNQVIVATYQGRMMSLDPQNRSVHWQREFSVYRNFSVDGASIYLTDESGTLYALDRSTGATLWQQEGLKGRRPSAPLGLGSWVMVGDAAGKVYWLQAADGQIESALAWGDEIVGAPMMRDLFVVLYGRNGHLMVLK